MVHKMHEQIANHMRVCVAIGDGIESLRGIAASEPILSEAASKVMSSPSFSLSGALSRVLSGYCINQGDRGELLVAAFFTWARDRVVVSKPERHHEQACHIFSVTDLFQHLLSSTTYNNTIKASLPSFRYPKGKPMSFEEEFHGSKMHFNHVIKPHQQKILARQYLPFFMARGAAALGANCQPGFDAVYPFLYNSTDLNVKNVSFIIVQVKNDSSRRCGDDVFKKMDPFKCGLLNGADKVNGRFPIPIIRIVFSLSEPGGHSFTQKKYESPSDGAEALGSDGHPLFTSYDYLCSGVSQDILQPVAESGTASWEALLNKRDMWEELCRDAIDPDILRSNFPIDRCEGGHFSSWVDEAFLPC